MLYDFLTSNRWVSRFFLPLAARLDARDDRRLERGVLVSARKPLVPALLPALLLGINSFLPFFIAYLLLSFACRSFIFLPLLVPAALSIALGAWLLLVAVGFNVRLYPCAWAVIPVSAFLNDAKLYREEVVDTKSGKTARVSGMRVRVYSRGSTLTVRALDDTEWCRQTGELDKLGLGAALGCRLESKTHGIASWDYVYRVVEDTRIQAVPRLLSSEPTGRLDAIPLTGELSWNFAHLPHMLIAGGTGGGKSTFIYYLIAEFLRLGNGNGFAGEVYICDPKNAELASLSHVIGSDRVGVSPAQIAKVVRLCREEMDRRYEYMQDPERFRFGANAFTYGLNPVFLIFDEVAAFKAGADKKTFAEVWDNLTQLVLKARAANVFVILAMQQPRADTISTDIRDNLGARVSLGTLSREGYQMAFGCSVDAAPIEEKGTGYIMLDGWDAPRPFKAPFADYSKVDYPKELKRLYIAAQRRNGVSPVNPEGETAEKPADIQDA